MGNIVRGRKTEDRIKAERTLVTVRAAGAFKSKVTSVKKKTAAKEINEIIEWKFGRKNTRTGQHQGRRTTAYEVEEETLDNTDKEVIKFVRRYVQQKNSSLSLIYHADYSILTFCKILVTIIPNNGVLYYILFPEELR